MSTPTGRGAMAPVPGSAPVIVVGAGSHARVVVAALVAAGRVVLGYVDDARAVGAVIDRIPVLGGDAVLSNYAPHDVELAIGMGALPRRQEVFDRLKAAGYRIAGVVHPSVVISGAVELGEGCQLQAAVVLQPGSTIGANVLINTRASIDHEAVIGAHAIVSPGAVLCGNVTVGVGATIGPGATVTRGREIGAGAVVAASAVVLHDVPSYQVVYGTPARPKAPRHSRG